MKLQQRVTYSPKISGESENLPAAAFRSQSASFQFFHGIASRRVRVQRLHLLLHMYARTP